MTGRRAVQLGIGAVAIAGCLLLSASARSTGSIDVDTSTQVFAVGRGGAVHRLTRGPEGHYTPVWSPDGRRFVTITAATVEVRGRGGRLLHSFHAPVWSPSVSISWSPDGRRLAFVTVHGGGKRHGFVKRLVTASLDGGDRRVLTRRHHLTGTPRWSPDGRTIYFERYGGRHYGIYAVGSRGGSPRLVIGTATRSELSADGRWFVFFRFAAENELLVAHSDGSHQRTVARVPFAGPYGWVPNGRRIFLFRRDGTGYHLRLASHLVTFQEPGATLGTTDHLVWSPDRRRIAWTAGGYAKDVVVRSMRTDGTDLRTLARFTSKSLYTEIDSLSWSPGGRILVEVHEHWGD
jgi:Tol biopolymer transport system component